MIAQDEVLLYGLMMALMTCRPLPANSNEVAAAAQDVQPRVRKSDVTFNGDVDSLFAALGIEEAVAELV